MTVADELATRARHFYALARKALDPSTKDRLVRLADDYLKQAQELRQSFAKSLDVLVHTAID